MTGVDLRRERLKKNLSQLRLCMNSGVSRWRYRLCEAGLAELTPNERKRIARVLKKRTEDVHRNGAISAPVRL